MAFPDEFPLSPEHQPWEVPNEPKAEAAFTPSGPSLQAYHNEAKPAAQNHESAYSREATIAPTEDVPFCKDCDEKPAVWYCSECRAMCNECWRERKPHKRNSPEHERTAFRDYKFISRTLDSELSDNERKELHKNDYDNLWFSINGGHGSLELEEFPCFSRVLAEHQRQIGIQRPQYPRLASFIGKTGVGKSAIIRLLIEHAWDETTRHNTKAGGVVIAAPVVGKSQGSIPTSGDVHLYRDVLLNDAEKDQVLLYADCEGFYGGSQKPTACSHAWPLTDHVIPQGLSEITKWANLGLGYISSGLKRPLTAATKREDAVGDIFPKLLYNFSDVIVNVMTSQAARQMELDIAKLLEWAETSHAAATNRLSLPHLIIVLNQSEKNSEWDPEKTASCIFEEQKGILEENETAKAIKAKFQNAGFQIRGLEDLLQTSYSSVQFIRLPRRESCRRLTLQLKELHKMIYDVTKRSLETKRERRMLLSASNMDEFFSRAFDHYSTQASKPFNHLEKLISLHPLPDKFTSSISALMASTFESLSVNDESPDTVSGFCDTMAPLASSIIALDVVRTFGKLPGSLIDIYCGGTSQPDESVLNTLKNSYKSKFSKAFSRFTSTALRCQFVDGTGARCVNKHATHPYHQNSQGSVIGPGSHKSELFDKLTDQWETKFPDSLRGLDQEVDQAIHPSENETIAQSNHDTVWPIHRRAVEELYRTVPSLEMADIFTCLWCLRNVPSELLPCGHGICSACLPWVSVQGQDRGNDPRLRVINRCSLHHVPRIFDPPSGFLTLPNHVGRRVLSLDGGGVRGLIEIRILTAFEKELGGEIPIQRFFDLIGGTGTGGLLAMGLGIGSWALDEVRARLPDLMTQGFTKHSEWTVPQHLMKEYMVGSTYNKDMFMAAVDAEYGNLSDQRMIGSGTSRSSENSIKVFVTATIGNNEQQTVFTNYVPQPDAEDELKSLVPYRYEAASAPRQDFTLREAAMATCAAPTYFPPLFRGRVEYWAGGVSLNNPAAVAASEEQRIWPSRKDTIPDMLLSIGNGRVKETTAHADDSAWFFIPWKRQLYELRKLLYQNINSEKTWDENFSRISGSHPTRYVRLNPEMPNALQNIDDLEAFNNGSLETIVSCYLGQESIQRRIADVGRVLVATSFYFQAAQDPQRNEAGHFIIKGDIFCRFPHGSDTAKGLGRLIRKLANPCFELISPGSIRWPVHDAMISNMERAGIYSQHIELEIANYNSNIDFVFNVDGSRAESISGSPFSLKSLMKKK